MTAGGSHGARRLAAAQSEPSEAVREQWRHRSSRRRQREISGVRIYRVALPEGLVAGALMAGNHGEYDLANHEHCEHLLGGLFDTFLRGVIDQSSDLELKADITRLLREFAR